MNASASYAAALLGGWLALPANTPEEEQAFTLPSELRPYHANVLSVEGWAESVFANGPWIRFF